MVVWRGDWSAGTVLSPHGRKHQLLSTGGGTRRRDKDRARGLAESYLLDVAEADLDPCPPALKPSTFHARPVPTPSVWLSPA